MAVDKARLPWACPVNAQAQSQSRCCAAWTFAIYGLPGAFHQAAEMAGVQMLALLGRLSCISWSIRFAGAGSGYDPVPANMARSGVAALPCSNSPAPRIAATGLLSSWVRARTQPLDSRAASRRFCAYCPWPGASSPSSPGHVGMAAGTEACSGVGRSGGLHLAGMVAQSAQYAAQTTRSPPKPTAADSSKTAGRRAKSSAPAPSVTIFCTPELEGLDWSARLQSCRPPESGAETHT